MCVCLAKVWERWWVRRAERGTGVGKVRYGPGGAPR